ncbi:Ferric iron ABC transporter, iron-binding protein [hydrothermal vent metagenome]|uniref:Ferric iron ABC transporter, iron-binding protein n=1 Tax=hydrothermal vent metagenome TaxID=652676 RepID=A0A3B0TWK3_9ZZZZ
MISSNALAVGFAGMLGVLASLTPVVAQNKIVNIYSYREADLIQPILDKFSAETGIKTNVLFAGNGLIERAVAEGKNSPVDVILTVDIGNLAAAKSLGASQKLSDNILERVPAQYRDKDGQWVALSLRARVFYASKTRVEQNELNYADLVKPEWKGRLCTRSGQHPYSIGLIASRIAHFGVSGAREWLKGVRDNLAMRPTGNDRAQVKAVFSGACDLAIGNTYYMGLMLSNTDNPEQQQWANAVKIIYPDVNGNGTHVNVTGAVLAANAPDKANGEKLISFLLSNEAQSLYADANYEFPVVDGVAPSKLVASWGKLVADKIALTKIADQRKAASELVDQLRFDDGPQN